MLNHSCRSRNDSISSDESESRTRQRCSDVKNRTVNKEFRLCVSACIHVFCFIPDLDVREDASSLFTLGPGS